MMLNWFRKKKQKQAEVQDLSEQTKAFEEPKRPKHPKRSKPLYRFEYGALSNFEGRNIIGEIRSHALDGIVIEQLFSEEELAQMRKGIDDSYPEKFNPAGDVFIMPVGFASFAAQTGQSEEAKEAYFEGNVGLPEEMAGLLNVDFQERIEDAFTKITAGKAPIVSDGPDGKGKFPFATIRVVPESCRMNPHCGNFFYEPFIEFYTDLEKNVKVKNQLSFFVLVTPPEKGGELVMFNLRWEDGQRRGVDEKEIFTVTKGENTVFTWKAGDGQTDSVPMKPGDMIVFAAGEIWHMVDQPHGSIDRVTIGGFIGESKTEEGALCYWS